MLNKFSIRSKLLALVLTLGISMAIGIAWVAWSNAISSMKVSAEAQLTSLREARRHEIEVYFKTLIVDFSLQAENPILAPAVLDIRNAFDSFDVTRVDIDALRDGYDAKYFKDIKEYGAKEGNPVFERHAPSNPRGQLLQLAYYINNPGGWEEKAEWLESQEPWRIPEYDDVHKTIHEYFFKVTEGRGYEDIMLIDPDGNIVYTTYKESDLGVNVLEGTMARTSLAEAFIRATAVGNQGNVVLEDFRPYPPSFYAPAAFMAAPVFAETGDLVGVIATEVPIGAIDEAMTASGKWKESGFGDSGETYLVGADRYMRSSSRFLIEDKKKYLEAIEKIGTPADMLAQIEKSDTSVLMQKVETASVEAAFRGEQGFIIVDDYRGVPVMSSYSLVDAGGMRWAILAEMDVEEAYSAADSFRKKMLLTTTAAAILLSLAALWLAGLIMKPVEQLAFAANKLAEGERGIRVPDKGTDEFAVLGQRFNAMAGELEARADKLEGQSKAYETMLRSIFPEMVADRLGAGDRVIAETHDDVSVLIVLIEGIESLMVDRTANETLKLLNDLVGSFDSAGERIGVDKVKTLGEIYVGVCSLSGHRLDHVRRCINTAKAFSEIVGRFNLTHGMALSIQVGIASGEVDGGVVGTQRLVYDVWGLPVAAARRAAEKAEHGSIGIAESSMKDIEALVMDAAKPLGDIHLGGQNQIIEKSWQLPMNVLDNKSTTPSAGRRPTGAKPK